MFYQLPDNDIDRFIEEDVPYGDLTTSLLGIGALQGKMTFTARNKTVVCGTEEAARVLEKCGAEVTCRLQSGTAVEPGVAILSAGGYAESLHAGWKVALNILEYASGIATGTRNIVNLARAVNPGVSIVTTRKSFPGTKKVVIKAIMAGGALPHRLGLSESILVFRQHTAFCGGLDGFLETIASLKAKAPEHKIIVEAESAEDAMKIAAAGVDIIQLDKFPVDKLSLLVQQIHKEAPGVKISVAGGINEENAADYAAAGVDIIVLSAVYFGTPSDIGVIIHP